MADDAQPEPAPFERISPGEVLKVQTELGTALAAGVTDPVHLLDEASKALWRAGRTIGQLYEQLRPVPWHLAFFAIVQEKPTFLMAVVVDARTDEDVQDMAAGMKIAVQQTNGYPRDADIRFRAMPLDDHVRDMRGDGARLINALRRMTTNEEKQG